MKQEPFKRCDHRRPSGARCNKPTRWMSRNTEFAAFFVCDIHTAARFFPNVPMLWERIPAPTERDVQELSLGSILGNRDPRTVTK